jgi:hypothetical protein
LLRRLRNERKGFYIEVTETQSAQRRKTKADSSLRSE